MILVLYTLKFIVNLLEMILRIDGSNLKIIGCWIGLHFSVGFFSPESIQHGITCFNCWDHCSFWSVIQRKTVPFNWEGLRRFSNLREQFPSSIKKTASIQQQLVQEHAFHYIQSWIWRKKQQNANSNWSTLKVVLAKWYDDSCPELGFTGHRPQPNAYLCPMQPLYWALKLW